MLRVQRREPGTDSRAGRYAFRLTGYRRPAPAWPLVSRPSEKSASEARQAEKAQRSEGIRSASVIRFHSTSETGLVSVVIPTYNRDGIIGRAIESALAQTYSDLHVIVADDGSSDNTRAVVEAYGSRVTYMRQPNAGVSAARNFGMRHAQGEFIAFLDSDDGWRPWKIEAQVAALRRHPEAGLAWTDMSAVDEADQLIDTRHLRVMYSAYEKVDIEKTLAEVDRLGALSARVPLELASAAVRKGDLSSAILLGNFIHTSTALFRRSWCEETGGFDESYARAGEDYEFYIRLCSPGPVIFIDAPSTLYRIGAADQLTAPSMMLEIARNNLRAVQKWIPKSGSHIRLPSQVVRRRLADSFAWVGEAELEAGHRWMAACRLSESLAVWPRVDRRALLLASCGLPFPVRDGLRFARRALFTHVPSRPGRGSPA
jgi:GT2 family glycosyltransferase